MKRKLEVWAARLVLTTLRRSPLPLATRLGYLYARLLDRAIPRLRRTALSNLRLALPEVDAESVTDGVFRSIGRVFVALARFPDLRRQNISQWIRYEGFQHFHDAKSRGRGVLVATAHLGNWELSAFSHALMTEPLHVVVRPLDNAAVDELIETRRRLSGNQVITKKDARSVLRALGRNEAVGILVDQNVSPAEGVFVPFFGIPACTGRAFARIANHSGATVIPGYAVWSDSEKKYVLHFEAPVEMSGDDDEDTARIHSRLEAAIRRYPDQWLWVHRRWKTRPSDEHPAT